MRRSMSALACALLGMSIASAQPSAVPGEMLVQFKSGATQADKARALSRANASAIVHIGSLPTNGRGDLVLVRHRPELPAQAAQNALAADPAVAFAEPNWIYEHQATATDTYYASGQLWGMKGGFGSNADAAWATGYTGSPTTYIGVIDEGIQYNHPELAGQVRNPGEPLTPNGVDDDGNGFVDDIYGWDFAGMTIRCTTAARAETRMIMARTSPAPSVPRPTPAAS